MYLHYLLWIIRTYRLKFHRFAPKFSFNAHILPKDEIFWLGVANADRWMMTNLCIRNKTKLSTNRSWTELLVFILQASTRSFQVNLGGGGEGRGNNAFFYFFAKFFVSIRSFRNFECFCGRTRKNCSLFYRTIDELSSCLRVHLGRRWYL